MLLRVALLLVTSVGGFAGSAIAADGAALYAKQCASCHGPDGRAETPVAKAVKAPPLAQEAWSSDAVVSAIRANSTHKPVSSRLSDVELEAITGHLRALSGKP